MLLLGAVMFLVIGIAWSRISPIAMGDFKVVYYSSRCLLQHGDPYSERDVLRVYRAEGREPLSEPELDRQVKTRFFYPPTAFTFTVPFALMGYGAGHLIWMFLSSGCLILAAVLMWDLAADFAPMTAGAFLGLFLVNSFWLLMIGNAAGIVVSLSAVTVWCFLRDRFVPAGVLCLAISLALKPHDSGLVWLFFLLAGGTLRKRALQTLLALLVISLPAALWVMHVSPHWMEEMLVNMASFSGVGGIADPGPNGMAGRNMDSLVELQSAVSIFSDNPRIYNSISYGICGVLLVPWVIKTLKIRSSQPRVWLGLAVIAPLSMLPIYHLQHDAKLLLLTIPACSMLWAEGGIVSWLAVSVTGLGIVINGDIFSGIRIMLTRNFFAPQLDFPGKIQTALFTRPAPLILLVMAFFFLWAYTCWPLSSTIETKRPDRTGAPIES